MHELVPQERSPCDMHVTIVGSDIEDDGLDVLNKAALHEAIYHCYKGYPPVSLVQEPRTAVEQSLRAWSDDSNPISHILWLAVAQGVNKSVAAQKVIDLCQSSDRFVATFFFHSEQERDQRRALFPTIAYQLATSIDGLRTPLSRILSEKAAILEEELSISAQFESLIVRPFQESSSIPLRSYIVAIVGLDELKDPQFALEVLNLIARAITTRQLPLRFLISGQAEALNEVFASEPLKSCSSQILLSDTVSVSTESSAPSDLHHSGNSSHAFLRHLLPSKKAKHSIHTALSHTGTTSHMDSFPRLVTVQRSNGHAESYTRSLMMNGHGFPLWYPGGDLGKPIDYLQKGVSIGDVGVLDRDGLFDFCFNIFLPPDDPIHSHLVPREFKSIEGGLDPSDIHFQPEYFEPGSVITSKGVTLTRKAESPLNLEFSSTEREGGIVVLPNGASREDMVKTERIHDYAKRHAPYWYQDVNGYGGVVHTNGSLFIVTGCDKTNDWAIASFPSYSGCKTPLDLQYTYQPDYGPSWTDHNTARTSSYAPSTSKSIPADFNSKHQCVFIRGMRISLSSKSWEDILPVTDSAKLYYTYILRTPSSLELLMNTVLVYLRLRISERRALKMVTPNRLQLFHPNFVIGQVLLQQNPDSDVALVDDSVWCTLTHESICTISEVNEVVTSVFKQNDVVEKNGIVTLVPKAGADYGTISRSPPLSRGSRWTSIPSLPKFLKQRPRKKDIHWVQDIPVSEHAKLF